MGAELRGAQESYEDAIKRIGSFRTIEGFWRLYSHLKRPEEDLAHIEYHVFKDGVKPMWEDSANLRGGKWALRVPKQLSSIVWEKLVRIAIQGARRGRVAGRAERAPWLTTSLHPVHPTLRAQLMALIGEQFDVGHEICGVVVSGRASETIISVWNKNAENFEATARIKCARAALSPATPTASRFFAQGHPAQGAQASSDGSLGVQAAPAARA